MCPAALPSPRFARARFLLVALPLLAATACSEHRASAAAPTEPVVLHVSTDGEFLAFTPTDLTCPAGARVRVIFKHEGQRIPQKHNWVLIMPGTSQAVEKAASAAGEAAGWLPKNDSRILAATPLCSPGGEAVVEFTAPAPGDYPFICSTPGHAFEMHGTLHVTPG
jgi:azurin